VEAPPSFTKISIAAPGVDPRFLNHAATRGGDARPMSRAARGCMMGAMRTIGVFCFVAAAVCAAQPALKNPFANDPRAAEEGRITFRGSCALCHGIRAEEAEVRI